MNAGAGRCLGGVAAVVCALFATTPAVAQPAAAQGWAFTWSSTTTARGQPVPNAGMVVDVTIWNGRARIVPRAGQQPLRALLGDGGVIVVRDRDSVLTVLNHGKREALLATIGELAALGSGMGAMQLAVSDVTSTVRRGGAAPALDGLTARQVTLDQGYTMSVRVQEMQRSVQMSEATTLDLSAALDARDPGFRAFALQFLRAFGKPREVRAALAPLERGLPRGVPLRSRTVSLTVAGGDTLRSETIGTMSMLRRTAIDTTAFLVPAGYRTTEVRRLLQMPGAR